MNLSVWQPAPRALRLLLAGMSTGLVPDLAVTGVEADSRRVCPGQLFLACPGAARHGLEFVTEAVARGAAAVAWDAGPAPGTSVPSLQVPGLGHKMGEIAARYYGHPSRNLFVVGITGTDGKTSCAHILAEALARLGRLCGYLGTLGYGVLGQLEPATHTSPPPVRLQEWLARFVAGSAQAAALEVSSHALAQERVNGVAFDVAVLTNIGRDHLDYHRDLQAYIAAKHRLFHAPGLGRAVLNSDDAIGARWLRELPAGVEPIAYGLKPRAAASGRFVYAVEVLAQPHGLFIDLDSSWGQMQLTSGLLGRFNAYNLLAVLAVLLADGVAPSAAIEALAGVATVPGRMDVVAGPPARPLVVVDYAHTPGALEQALQAVGEHTAGRVYCVFGCGGERDSGKRPLMGAAAARFADAVWITDDNPRSEDPGAIVADILAGMPAGAPVAVEHDRGAAIAAAIAGATPADAVLIAGKGHETTQQIGVERRCFDDREAARRILEAA